jgi:hypothetical protein
MIRHLRGAVEALLFHQASTMTTIKKLDWHIVRKTVLVGCIRTQSYFAGYNEPPLFLTSWISMMNYSHALDIVACLDKFLDQETKCETREVFDKAPATPKGPA